MNPLNTKPNPSLNRAIVAYLRTAGPCSAATLMGVFCKGGAEARRSFRKRLRYLADAGALVTHGSWRLRVFEAGPPDAHIPGGPRPPRTASAAANSLPAPPANVAPPRQVQVMFGPVYVPPRGPALRAGALDHQACASRGHAC